MKLLCSALLKFVFGLVLVASLLFVPASTLAYPNGWLFLGLLFVPMLVVGIILWIKAPALLQKRLDAKEEDPTQKRVVAIMGLLFVGGFVVAGLDHRYGWSTVPTWAVTVAAVVLTVSYGLYAEVMRENAYLSRTVAIQEQQRVVDTGLYGIVRHPMYAVTVWLFLAIPLVLGSLWACLFFLPYIPLIMLRIRHEETLLETELEGYDLYKQRVKYRLVPFIW